LWIRPLAGGSTRGADSWGAAVTGAARSAPLPERDGDPLEPPLGDPPEILLERGTLRAQQRVGQPPRGHVADHPDPLVIQHERMHGRELLVAATERAGLLRRLGHAEVRGLGAVLR